MSSLYQTKSTAFRSPNNNISSRFLTLLLSIFFVGVSWGQTPNGYLDFGTTTNGTTATTANTGFGGVRVGTGGGGFTIQNPGQSIGSSGELRGIAPTAGSVNSVGITSGEYGTASATFTITFELHLSGGSSGNWYFFAGNGNGFGSAQSATFTGSDIFTGIQWAFGASNGITSNNRGGSSWTVINGTPFTQNVSYFVTIVGNNTSSTVNYGASNSSSIGSAKYDLWVNGNLIGDDLSKGQLTTNSSINAFRFYGESSTGNVATISLDNIRWYNTCTLPPTHLVLASVPTTGTVGTNLSSFTAEARSGSTSGPLANFTGPITVAKVNGNGTISGTTAPNAIAGVATYSNIQFSSADNYTINASASAPIINSSTSGNITVSAPVVSPTLNAITLSSALTAAYGSASNAVSATAGGSNLSSTITITPAANFEVSTTSSTAGFTSSAITGVSNSTNFWTRLSSTAPVGDYNNTTAAVISSSGATSVNVTTSSSGNAVTCTNGAWIGGASGNWSTGSNWCGGSVPTSASNVTIPSGVTVNLDATTTTVASLTIDGTLEVAAGKQLTVDGTLTNNGVFTLKTGATLDPGTSYSQAGNGVYNVEQYITGAGGSSPSGRFWYLGSPVVSATSNVYDAAGSNIVKGWNEVSNIWEEITTNSSPLEVGKGYYVKAGANTTLNFTGGALNNASSYTLNLTRTGTTNSSRGFNLVSNPYPSYLDWDGVSKSASVSNTIWYRTANSSNVNVFDTYNAPAGTGTNTNGAGAVTRYIPPMQSYWVFVTPNNTTGTITFDNGNRSHYISGVQGLRSTAQDFPMFLRLNVEQGTNRDQMILYMKPEASSSYDAFDSDKMFLSGTPQLYTKIADKKLVINGMKNNKKQTQVPLFMDIPNNGLYTLHAEEFNVEDGLILLEDKQEQLIEDITLNDTYTFYATAGVCSNRFVIHFMLPNAVPTAQGPSNNWVEDQTSFEEVGDVQITSDARGKVVITLDQTENSKVEGTVQIIDANGRVVYNGALEGVESTIQLEVPSGVYYLQVQSGSITEKKKLFIQD